MKILHINCNYIYSSLHQCLIENLNDLGFSNDVFVATYDKKRSIVKTNSYVKVEECFNKWDRLFFDYKQSKILKTIQNSYDINDFDCIHAYTLFTDGNSAYQLSKKYNIPYVVAVRDTDVNAFFAKRVLLRKRGVEIMKNAKKVFFLSESYRNEVFKKYVPKEICSELFKKTMIIPNGIDEFWINNEPATNVKSLDTKDIHLLYVGLINKRKNIVTTQAAMKVLEKRGIHATLTIVGRIDDLKIFKKISSDENTIYCEARPKEQLIEMYRKADIFVMPSLTETFGLVYAEAMSQGLPVVYSKGQGFDGQFEEGSVGYAADPRSAESVAESIIKIINGYASITNNVIDASHQFNWEIIANKYCDVYREMEMSR